MEIVRKRNQGSVWKCHFLCMGANRIQCASFPQQLREREAEQTGGFNRDGWTGGSPAL